MELTGEFFASHQRKYTMLIYDLHRLDIDYEYPGSPEQARGYVELLKELRQGLDAHAKSKGISYKYPLTVSYIDITDLTGPYKVSP
jgi:GH18 family chitinase